MENSASNTLLDTLKQNRISLGFIPDDKIKNSNILSYLKDAMQNHKTIFITTGEKSVQNNTSIDTWDMSKEIDFIVEHNGEIKEETLSKLIKHLGGYDYAIFDELNNLCGILATDSNDTKNTKRMSVIKALDTLTMRREDMPNIAVLSTNKACKQSMKDAALVFNREYFELHNIPLTNTEYTPQTTPAESFFDEVDNTASAIPKVNIGRIDTIIQNNKAQYGDMIFFSGNEGSQMIRYALDAVIPAAPLYEQLCHISPFRTQRDVKKSLKHLDSIYPLTEKAIKRTTIVTSESFRGKTLDTSSILMEIIKNKILEFREKLDDMGKEYGICIIDTTGIDMYGAEIDHPSLKWYAKSNDLLIIIGADTAEERYTYKRQKKIENSTKTHPQIPKDTQQ